MAFTPTVDFLDPDSDLSDSEKQKRELFDPAGLFLTGSGPKTQDIAPWKEAQPYLMGTDDTTGLFPEAERIYREHRPEFYRTESYNPADPYQQNFYKQSLYRPDVYGNQTYAGFDQLQADAQNQIVDYAGGLDSFIDTTQGAFNRSLDGSLLYADSNPYLRQNISDFRDIVTENLVDPGISNNEDAAIQAGQYGSSRHGLADYKVKKDANEVIARHTNDMMNKAYNTGIGQMNSAMSMAPSMVTMGTMPANLLNTVGGQRQNMTQRGIDENIWRFDTNQAINADQHAFNEAQNREESDFLEKQNYLTHQFREGVNAERFAHDQNQNLLENEFNNNSPWQRLGNYQNVLTGNYMGTGQSQPLTPPNRMGAVMGGATTGASVGGPWGAVIGAGLGLLNSRNQ